jgi:hypothetical protein
VEPLVWPGADLRPALARATHLLTSVAPGEAGDPVLMAAGDRHRRAAPHIEWAGYLSTTGVYGDHAGGWVDETTPLTPSTRRGQMRVAAEEAWRALAERSGLPLHIFRLAGIYGPGRGPFEKVRDGTARRIVKPGQVFSRTHVEDIAQVLHASILRPDPGAAYNVCDDDPAPPEDVLPRGRASGAAAAARGAVRRGRDEPDGAKLLRGVQARPERPDQGGAGRGAPLSLLPGGAGGASGRRSRIPPMNPLPE